MRARRPWHTASGAAAARASSRASASPDSPGYPVPARSPSWGVRRRARGHRFRLGCLARSGTEQGQRRRRHRRTGVLQPSVRALKPLVSQGEYDRSAPIRARWIRHFGGFRPRGQTCSRTRENGKKRFRPIIRLCGRRTDVLVCRHVRFALSRDRDRENPRQEAVLGPVRGLRSR